LVVAVFRPEPAFDLVYGYFVIVVIDRCQLLFTAEVRLGDFIVYIVGTFEFSDARGLDLILDLRTLCPGVIGF